MSPFHVWRLALTFSRGEYRRLNMAQTKLLPVNPLGNIGRSGSDKNLRLTHTRSGGIHHHEEITG
ncbi:hypothetical protein [Citrobacter portucalensis]|uniref:hypothetical protein n=1 Tax=Citrobacter portucalensis TaxID=1639133 RepID=UPI0006DA614E|nr:hypothetical protein [Citrobacter portucalensis]MDT7469770.1 hypothetical protein [Citrobacter portucalensis]OCO58842.1 hypothetical protein AN688_0223170 [Citrobacter freundii]OEH19828.1 hypothetical protein AN690_0222785 [Citrobacter freundii]